MPSHQQYALAGLFGPGREEMTSHTPHARHLGMKVIETGPGVAILMLPYRPELIGDPIRKVVFGGAITALLDQTYATPKPLLERAVAEFKKAGGR